MQRIRQTARTGFTLLELMLVIAVIGILMAMLGAAAYSARQRAYATTATAEVQQIATAFKSYYLANHKWPKGWTGGADFTPLGKDNLGPLIGDEGTVYLDLSDFRIEGDAFLDPWGHAYEVATDAPGTPSAEDVFESGVSFPNHFRHYFEEGVYDRGADDWPWDGYGKGE